MSRGRTVILPPPPPPRNRLHEDALAMQKSELEIARNFHPPNPTSYGRAMINVALTYHDLDRHAMNASALEFCRRVLSPGHPDIATSLYNIGFTDEQAGDMRKAIDCAREAVVVWQAALPPGHPHLNLAEENVLRLERENNLP
jgi:hypothetical protein